MNFNKLALKIELHYFVVLAIRFTLIIGVVYFFLATYNWTIFEKYQLEEEIKNLSVDGKSQPASKELTALALQYEKDWIATEKKYNNTLGSICLVLAAGTFWFKTQSAKSETIQGSR
jgi:hypothetical protein